MRGIEREIDVVGTVGDLPAQGNVQGAAGPVQADCSHGLIVGRRTVGVEGVLEVRPIIPPRRRYTGRPD